MISWMLILLLQGADPVSAPVRAETKGEPRTMSIRFKKEIIDNGRFESAGVFDVNNDGVLDIVCGEHWYEGPDFKRKHKICDLELFGEYYDDFSTIALDVNGDGFLDFITGGWWRGTVRWRENPRAQQVEWPEHIIAEVGNVETTRAWDVDGDGEIEIVPNTPGGPLRVFKLKKNKDGKGTGEFDSYTIYDAPQGHGLGFGDVNGDGRGDFIFAHGWLEAPKDPFKDKWIYHKEFDFGAASIPILVVDVNGDGLPDIIVGNGHGYGLDWYEQGKDAKGNRTWTKHPIDPYCSQYHDLIWADIDNDGEKELITGQRYRAHCGNDPGEWDDIGVFYFKWNGESFSKQVIDYGSPGESSGVGIHFAVVDLDGDGWLDIVAPGKDGLQVFYNLGGKTKK